jgi:hypothetical protein
MIIDWSVTVVGDRLVTVKKFQPTCDIEVRCVHTGHVVHTIRTGYQDETGDMCVTPVPGYPELIVACRDNGAVHLWDIEKGARAYECMHANAGVHVRQIVQLERPVVKIVASSTRFMCEYGGFENKRVSIVYFNDEQ